MKKNILIAGAGKIGSAIAGLLAATPDYTVTVADASPRAGRHRAQRADPAVRPGAGLCLYRRGRFVQTL
jgi:saccharopine dehydrogenase-like NADP-dependent oxidoreductase